MRLSWPLINLVGGMTMSHNILIDDKSLFK